MEAPAALLDAIREDVAADPEERARFEEAGGSLDSVDIEVAPGEVRAVEGVWVWVEAPAAL